jgi:hypothetical protein
MQQQQQPPTAAGGVNAWARVNSLLNTKEAVADALLQHLQHVHATLPRGGRVHFRLLPGRLHILLREGSGRVTIMQGGPKRFEARLSSDAAKVRQLLCEYAWSARTYTLEVVVEGLGAQAVPVDSWVPNIKCAVVRALCPAAAAGLVKAESSEHLIESGSNEVLMYTLTAAGDEDDVLGYFCVGHEHVQAPEECSCEEDEDEEDEDKAAAAEEEEGMQLQDFDELACMLELTPQPAAPRQPKALAAAAAPRQPKAPAAAAAPRHPKAPAAAAAAAPRQPKAPAAPHSTKPVASAAAAAAARQPQKTVAPAPAPPSPKNR